MKFKDFQAPVLFSSTFKALDLGEKNSSTLKYFQGCMQSLFKCCAVLYYLARRAKTLLHNSNPLTVHILSN